MHNAAFAAAGIAARYQACDIVPAQLAEALERLRAEQVLGANLSLPHKEVALPLLDSLSAAARAIGAVNTVVRRGNQLHGDNTDAPGLLLALQDAGDPGQGSMIQGNGIQGAAAVLGAGGAARSAVWALRSQGREVYVYNRTPARAEGLVADLGGVAASLDALPWDKLSLVVNASSAGLGDPDTSPLPDGALALLPEYALVYDMVYKPAQTRLLRQAQAAGRRGANGLGMLAHQARLSFLAWTGQDLPVGVFLGALPLEGL